jgi:glycosyltransferase involved in cell wall biosynthesis
VESGFVEKTGEYQKREAVWRFYLRQTASRVQAMSRERLDIAFYAPLKSPGHAVPSGDRLMARMLVACLARAGHRVTVVSDLRAYVGDPGDVAAWARVRDAAAGECNRIAGEWTAGQPDMWFCYHPYYKSPDLIGPPLAARFGLPYVTCEASYSARRNLGVWVEMQAHALAAVKGAALNLCLTARDRAGLQAAAPGARLERFAPFIAVDGFGAAPAPLPGHLVCVAMMRAGDKFDSYRRLAAWVALLPQGLDWHLTVAGDGPMRAEVQALFRDVAGRITWAGAVEAAGVAALLVQGAVYVWPGCGEAYGLAYLEAQAAGVPVVAQAVAGVPEVVVDGVTGMLVPGGDDRAAADAIARLLRDAALQRRMGQAARAHVAAHHAMPGAAARLDSLLRGVMR